VFKAYLTYWWKAQNEHSIHSPFVFDLYQKVIKDKKSSYYAFEEIEQLRKTLLESEESVEVEDLGAGSKRTNSPQRKVAEIAKNASKSPKIAQLLFRLVNYFQPLVILDLGTSLGLTTSYLARAAPSNAQFYSFEGSENLLEIASKNFQTLQIHDINLVKGNIDDTLPKIIENVSQIDFAFVDANHRYEPTKRYFELMLPKLTENSVLVFDDIYWSAEMTRAWH